MHNSYVFLSDHNVDLLMRYQRINSFYRFLKHCLLTEQLQKLLWRFLFA